MSPRRSFPPRARAPRHATTAGPWLRWHVRRPAGRDRDLRAATAVGRRRRIAVAAAGVYLQFDRTFRDLVTSAGSLVATTVVTSVLGFVFWLAAARFFSPAAVGLAASAITTMTLLGTVGVLGLGTLLIGEFGRQPGRERSLMTTALATSASASLALGLCFILVTPHVAPSLGLPGGTDFAALFAVGTAMTAVALVFDSAILGLLRGGLQLLRNSSFALGKLLALLVAGAVLHAGSGRSIFYTWVFGAALSLSTVAGLGLATRSFGIVARPSWSMLRGLRRAAVGHHAVNLGLQAPALALPAVATITMSAAKTASFYVAWQVAAFSFMTPVALSMALYAVAGTSPARLFRTVRMTLLLGIAAALVSIAILLVLAGQILRIFGDAYTTEGPAVLRIVCLCALPLVVKDIYIALGRIRGRLRNTAVLVIGGAVLEVLLAAAGAHVAGLPGFAAAALVTESMVGLAAVPTVVRALRPPREQAPLGQAGERTG